MRVIIVYSNSATVTLEHMGLLFNLLLGITSLEWDFNFVTCRDNLQLLRQRYYYATWKADGTRYMMLIMVDGCFLIDRNFKFRRVQMRFPWRYTNEVCNYAFLLGWLLALWLISIVIGILFGWSLTWLLVYFFDKGPADKMHHFTLLDGEMIIDTMPDSQKQERRYLIYDMMAMNQVSVIEVRFAMKFMEINIISADKVIYCPVFILPWSSAPSQAFCELNYVFKIKYWEKYLVI